MLNNNPNSGSFLLSVNGHSFEQTLDPDMPLLWVIRDVLGLTGTKFGCGKGLCGACTVHLDDEPVRSCITPVSAVGGKKITTIEGLSAAGDHPAQRAWIEHDVPQCGYCQAGQLMVAAWLIRTQPDPDLDTVNRLMTNLCRCGTYVRIKKAVLRAAELARESP